MVIKISFSKHLDLGGKFWQFFPVCNTQKKLFLKYKTSLYIVLHIFQNLSNFTTYKTQVFKLSISFIFNELKENSTQFFFIILISFVL